MAVIQQDVFSNFRVVSIDGVNRSVERFNEYIRAIALNVQQNNPRQLLHSSSAQHFLEVISMYSSNRESFDLRVNGLEFISLNNIRSHTFDQGLLVAPGQVIELEQTSNGTTAYVVFHLKPAFIIEDLIFA